MGVEVKDDDKWFFAFIGLVIVCNTAIVIAAMCTKIT